MSRKPPLDVVRVVRERTLDGAKNDLRRAADRAAEAEAASQRARDEEDAKRADAAAQIESERRGLQASISSRDLVRLAAFEHGKQTEVARAAERSAVAQRRSAEANEERDRRRGDLVDARRALDVVEKHQARWSAAKDRSEQEKVDEAAEESFSARRPRK